MQVEDIGTAAPLVQVVDVLGYNLNVKVFFQLGQSAVRGIGLCIGYVASSFIVKVEHHLRISAPGTGRCHIINIVTFPQTIRIAKSFQSAFSADTCPGEHDEFLFHDNSKVKNQNAKKRIQGIVFLR
mgnify:CR=1 FL=1